MNVHFFEPPTIQRLGGLDAAINGLREALRAQGIEVDGKLPENTTRGGHVAHFHGLWQPGHPRLAERCRALGIPVIVSPHGMLEPWAWKHKWWKKWPYFHLIEKRYLRRADCLLATAESEAARLRSFLGVEHVSALPLGLTGSAVPDYANARTQLGYKPGERVLLFLSRLHIKKGLELLLEALRRNSPQTGVRLVVVGGGEETYVRGLRAWCEMHRNMLPSIDWVGEVWGEARWSYFQAADLFCLPSYSENFGLAVLEALQVGTPVLTTSATPWADYLTNEQGYIVDPNVESVASSITQFLQSHAYPNARRGEIAAWTRARFSWEQLTSGYMALYEQAAASRSQALTR